MSKGKNLSVRVFKTAWFAKAARKARINDVELCVAMREAMQGQADDLGGGVFKKRLNDNMHRSIILAKGGRMNICLRKRTETTLPMMSWSPSAHWPRPMPG